MLEISKVIHKESQQRSNPRARRLHRLVTLALVMGPLLALTACGKDQDTKATPPAPTRPAGASELVVPPPSATTTDHLQRVDDTPLKPTVSVVIEPVVSPPPLGAEGQVTQASDSADTPASLDETAPAGSAENSDTPAAPAEVVADAPLTELNIVTSPELDAQILANPPQQVVDISHLRQWTEMTSWGGIGYRGNWPENAPIQIPLGVSAQPDTIRFVEASIPQEALSVSRQLAEARGVTLPAALELTYDGQGDETQTELVLGSTTGSFSVVVENGRIIIVDFSPNLQDDSTEGEGGYFQTVTIVELVDQAGELSWSIPPAYFARDATSFLEVDVASLGSGTIGTFQITKPNVSKPPGAPRQMYSMYDYHTATVRAQGGIRVTVVAVPIDDQTVLNAPDLQPFAVTDTEAGRAFATINAELPLEPHPEQFIDAPLFE